MTLETCTLAAGCFWGVEHHLKSLDGVVEATSGYTGGRSESPTYRDVCSGNTGHAEAVQIKFDPNKISFKEVVEFFWRLHDPTQLNRQGPDHGTQYRSAIFYHSDEQKLIAEDSKKAFDASGVFNDPAVTEITKASVFYPAEDYHQDYFTRNGGPICHLLREK